MILLQFSERGVRGEPGDECFDPRVADTVATQTAAVSICCYVLRWSKEPQWRVRNE